MADNGETLKLQAQQGSSFSIVRVLMLTGTVAAVVGGGYYALNEAQGPREKVKFTGVVTYQGQPVTVGSVMTEVVGDPMDFSIGFLDAEGRFSLETNGEPGASMGRHRVRISSMAPGIPPRPLVPPNYLESATTPLEIDVTSNPDANVVTFELEGEIPQPASAGGPPAGPPGAPPAAAAPSAAPTAAPTPAEGVAETPPATAPAEPASPNPAIQEPPAEAPSAPQSDNGTESTPQPEKPQDLPPK